MSKDRILRQEIRDSLDDVRRRIRGFTGLYTDENLIRDVLDACDETALAIKPDQRLKEARRNIEDRCARLVRETNRFSNRDPAAIAAARAQAVAAIDVLQDVVIDLYKEYAPVPHLGGLLKRRGL